MEDRSREQNGRPALRYRLMEVFKFPGPSGGNHRNVRGYSAATAAAASKPLFTQSPMPMPR
jgi:hypothetical protein